ncbi:MAG: MoaD/ThiS family protein [Armatimonadota bacterium]
MKVVFATALRSATNGEQEIELYFSGDVKSLLQLLSERYGEVFRKRLLDGDGYLKKYVNAYLDGKDVRFLKGRDTQIAGSAEILFLPAVSGG